MCTYIFTKKKKIKTNIHCNRPCFLLSVHPPSLVSFILNKSNEGKELKLNFSISIFLKVNRRLKTEKEIRRLLCASYWNVITWVSYVTYHRYTEKESQIHTEIKYIWTEEKGSTSMYSSACIAKSQRDKALTRFMTSVRSPDSSSSGVGGSGRFGAPPIKSNWNKHVIYKHDMVIKIA